ncbi:hypothetical protein SESBI_41606 [Sesbania bispinosa]|nr:hypothetical protein SESBI_41606 [Sesbania bispinosa]
MSTFEFSASRIVPPVIPPEKPPDSSQPKISFRDKVLGDKVPPIQRPKVDLLAQNLPAVGAHGGTTSSQQRQPSTAAQGGPTSSQQSSQSNGNIIINDNYVNFDSVVIAGDACHGEWLVVTRKKRHDNNSKKNMANNINQKQESNSKYSFRVLADFSEKHDHIPIIKSDQRIKAQGDNSIPNQSKHQVFRKKKRPRVAPPTIDIAKLVENATKGKAKLNGSSKSIQPPTKSQDTSNNCTVRSQDPVVSGNLLIKEVGKNIRLQDDTNLNLQGSRLEILNLNKVAQDLVTNAEEDKPSDDSVLHSDENGEIDMDESSDAEQDEWDDEVVLETNPMHEH